MLHDALSLCSLQVFLLSDISVHSISTFPWRVHAEVMEMIIGELRRRSVRDVSHKIGYTCQFTFPLYVLYPSVMRFRDVACLDQITGTKTD